jgi:phenylacetate-CoA ligase
MVSLPMFNMRGFIARNIGLGLNDLLKGYRVQDYLRTYQSHLHLEKHQIEIIQLEKYIKMIAHAYNHSPFYHNRIKELGGLPGDFKTLDDIKKIPPLSRIDIQNNWKEIIPENYPIEKLHKGSSSGSTGQPVFYFQDNNAASANDAALYICWSLAGWKLGMKGIHIWGNPSTVKNEWKRTSSKIKSLIFNHKKFPAYQLTDKNKLKALAENIQTDGYDFIDGYTNSIYLLAEFIISQDLRLKKPLKMVLTTAENLHDYQRNAIESVLGPVFDLYGCGEIHGIANECRLCGKYHVIDTHVCLDYGDIVDEFENRPLIITDLDNFSFPLIRYLNGDIGKPAKSKNNCSIPFSSMDTISGRQSDIIRLPDGGTLSVPSFFGSMLLKKVKGITRYQIIKDKIDHLTINFVTDNEFNDMDLDIVRDALGDYLSDKIFWDINIVDDIPFSETGKFKIVIDNTKR